MSNADEQGKSWWQTLPGVIAAVAAAITALTGLIAAVGNAGWFKSEPVAPGGSETRPAPAVAPALTPRAPAVPAAPARPEAAAGHAISLPSQRDYKLRSGSGGYYTATFTLLGGKLEPGTAEQAELTLRLRMTNHFGGGTNFWDDWFRLVVDGRPMAPERGLNEMVEAHAAKEGTVRFLVPKDLQSAVLRIQYYDGPMTDIPLSFAPPGT